MSYPTSRRYARTLAQAFPRDPSSACAVEVYRRPALQRLANCCAAVLLGLFLAALIVAGIRIAVPA